VVVKVVGVGYLVLLAVQALHGCCPRSRLPRPARGRLATEHPG
jgi:hypothetical protein